MKKQTFSNYVSSLSTVKTTEKHEVMKKIAAECGVSEITVFRWATGRTIPPMLYQQKISELTNIPVDDLFYVGV